VAISVPSCSRLGKSTNVTVERRAVVHIPAQHARRRAARWRSRRWLLRRFEPRACTRVQQDDAVHARPKSIALDAVAPLSAWGRQTPACRAREPARCRRDRTHEESPGERTPERARQDERERSDVLRMLSTPNRTRFHGNPMPPRELHLSGRRGRPDLPPLRWDPPAPAHRATHQARHQRAEKSASNGGREACQSAKRLRRSDAT